MKNIVGTAIDDGHFTTLVQTVKAADLVETLSPGSSRFSRGNRSPFSKLLAGTLDSVVQNKDLLTSILTYDVVTGKHVASDLKRLNSVNAVQGGIPQDRSPPTVSSRH